MRTCTACDGDGLSTGPPECRRCRRCNGTGQLTSKKRAPEDPHARFLTPILAEPDRDLHRLIYADFLADHDETGFPRDAERAGFIRVQCELARLDAQLDHEVHDTGMCSPYCTDCPRRDALRCRERELWKNGCLAWSEEVAWPLGQINSLNAVDCQAAVPFGEDGEDWILCRWRRGFVEELTCSWSGCRAHLDSIRQRTPLRRVRLTGELPRWGISVHDTGRLEGRNKIHPMPRGPRSAEDVIRFLLSVEWPGITFELPRDNYVRGADDLPIGITTIHGRPRVGQLCRNPTSARSVRREQADKQSYDDLAASGGIVDAP